MSAVLSEDLRDSQLAKSISRTYRVLDQRLAVLCESAPMMEHIHCFMHPLQTEEEHGQLVRAALFEAPSAQGPMIQVCCPELQFMRNEPLGHLSWVAFRRILMFMVLSRKHGHFVAHGAAVADERGRAALIVGTANAGKTSIMLELLRRGWRYAVDDYSTIRFADGKLRALTTGCTVTQNTFAMFPELEALKRSACFFNAENTDQWTINPCDKFASVAPDAALELSHVFFVFPNHGGESKIERYDPSLAMWLLQHRRFDARPRIGEPDLKREKEEYMLLRQVTEQAHCYRVDNGNLQTTVSQIENACRT